MKERFAAGEPYLREALKIRRQQTPDAWDTFHMQTLLGDALLHQGQRAAAEPFLLEGHAGLLKRADTIPEKFRKLRITQAVERLVKLYEAWGKSAEAEKWRKELVK